MRATTPTSGEMSTDSDGIVTSRASEPFHVMAKPIGPLCNLDCEYCFYLKKSDMFRGSKFRMTDDLLEAHVRDYIDAQPPGTPEVTFAWQGGEPTLLGLDFFKRAVEFQQHYRRQGMKISNALQTNGTKLDSSWCQFFKANKFLVGISMDGPEEFHNRYRKTKGGRGSYAEVKRGLDHLLAERVDFNVLTVIQRHNGYHGDEVYQGLKELGADFIQFIPIVERTGGTSVSSRSVLPEQFGSFLIDVFESWRIGDVGKIYVQSFDVALNAVMGNQNVLCVHAPECGRAVVLEHNGDLFACDHFVFPEYRIGNITEDSYSGMLDGEKQKAFGADKLKRLPPKCLKCSVRYLCNGGCPAHSFVPAQGTSFRQNYLCEGYLKFFTHIEPFLKGMKEALSHRLPACQYVQFLEDAKLKPGRNDICPCGSGKKYKHCCAAKGPVPQRNS